MGTVLRSSRWVCRCLYSHYFVNVIINWHSLFQCLPPSCYDGNLSICRLSVKWVYRENTAPVSSSSTNCFVVTCSKKFREKWHLELFDLIWRCRFSLDVFFFLRSNCTAAQLYNLSVGKHDTRSSCVDLTFSSKNNAWQRGKKTLALTRQLL